MFVLSHKQNSGRQHHNDEERFVFLRWDWLCVPSYLLLTGAFQAAYDGCLKALLFSCSTFAHVPELKCTAKHEQEMQRNYFDFFF